MDTSDDEISRQNIACCENFNNLFHKIGLLVETKTSRTASEINQIVDKMTETTHLDLFVLVILSNHIKNSSTIFHDLDSCPISFNTDVLSKLQSSTNLKDAVKLYITSFDGFPTAASDNKQEKMGKKQESKNCDTENQTDSSRSDGVDESVSKIDMANTIKLNIIGSDHPQYNGAYVLNEFCQTMAIKQFSTPFIDILNEVNSLLSKQTSDQQLSMPPAIQMEQFDVSGFLALTVQVFHLYILLSFF